MVACYDNFVSISQNKDSLCELIARGKIDFATDGAKDRLEVILRKVFIACKRTNGMCDLVFGRQLLVAVKSDLNTLIVTWYLGTHSEVVYPHGFLVNCCLVILVLLAEFSAQCQSTLWAKLVMTD